MHLPLLWPVAMSFSRDEQEARSILNLAMMKVFRALPSFDLERPLGPWMKAIATNCGIDAVRSRARHRGVGELSRAADQVVDADIEGQFTQAEILDLLKKLTDVQRAVLVLFAVEGFSHAEIAEKLGLSEANSRWHLHQARIAFKNLLLKSDRATGADFLSGLLPSLA